MTMNTDVYMVYYLNGSTRMYCKREVGYTDKKSRAARYDWTESMQLVVKLTADTGRTHHYEYDF